MHFLLIFTIVQFTICNAQQFVFQMKFVDAIGNTASITLGYDPNATDTFDSFFNEINSTSSPNINGINVGVRNTRWKQNLLTFANQSSFQTKKQIAKGSCGSYPIELDIIAKCWPVRAFWNRGLLNDNYHNGIVLTRVHPLGCRDTGGFITEMNSEDSALFDKNKYYYLSDTDTIKVFWVVFADSTLLTSSVSELATDKIQIRISPNPASDFITVCLNNTFGKLKCIDFYNSIVNQATM